MNAAERFDRLEKQIAGLDEKLDRVLVGETGKDGVFGRLHRVELAEEHRRRTLGRLWAAVVALTAGVLSGLWQSFHRN